MRFSSRAVQGALAWILVGCLVLAGFLLAVFHRPLAVAAGWEVTGAPTTLAPGVLDPPPTQQVAPPLGDGMKGPADVQPEGPTPARKALEDRLAALDVSKLAVGANPLSLGYEIVDAATGEVLAARNPDQVLIPASNTKLLTATAVLAAFDPQERFATRVLQAAPGRIVLVGGGDPMLAGVPAPASAAVRPASLQDLAALTAKALLAAGESSVTLTYDASLFSEPWNETWPAMYRDQVTRISALWADEGRDASRARSSDPAKLAATTFAAQLRAAGVAVSAAPTAGDGAGQEIARVESLPVHTLVEQAMLRSNNSFTEVLGRQLAIRDGQPATFAGAVAAIEKQLAALGLWDDSAVLRDASGLSRSNKVTPAMLAASVQHAAAEPRLSVILDGLPVAGVTGTLRERFTDSVSRPARGVARAKTGTLSFVATLVGTTLTADGRAVAYAFMTNGSPDGWAAKVWTDQGVGVVSGCGC